MDTCLVAAAAHDRLHVLVHVGEARVLAEHNPPLVVRVRLDADLVCI